ncbi:MAG TPA: family 78 glycoside hydrolase catalytic domain [Actinomycetes bacterium]
MEAQASSAADRVTTLRVDTLTNPIGLGNATPILSWRLSSGWQTAYQVQVASSTARLRQPDRWDSGKVPSGDSSNVAYAGATLGSRDAVVWRVRVWDGTDAASAWSAPASWEMGLLANGDWTARWIEHPDYRHATGGVPNPLPIFAKAFHLSRRVAKARLYVTGLGQYAARLNGAPVGEAVLEPGQTSYHAEVNYRTYDVTALLRRGANLLGIETGSGAYQRAAIPGRYLFTAGIVGAPVYGTPKVVAELDVTYLDGSRQTIPTDTSWRTRLGGTTYSSWWGGEDYDARRVPADWTAAASVGGAGWRDARLVDLTPSTTPTDTTPLVADPRPPVTVVRQARPVAVTRVTATGGGTGPTYLLDFGTNLSGLPQLGVSGPAGTTVTMIPAETADADGTVDVTSTGASATSQILYRYTLSGRGHEAWHAQFTYNGFRYLQVSGLASPPTRDTVTLLVTRASNRETASFDSSSRLLNSIYAITKQALENNMQSVLTDCPDREKGPYTGDNLHNADTELTLFDMRAYQGQLVRNMRTAQRPVPSNRQFPGMIANVAPEFHFVVAAPPGRPWFLDEPNWGGAVVLIPWNLYQVYGDTETMRASYHAMARWLDWEASTKAANKGDVRGLGDWSAAQATTDQAVIDYGYHRAVSTMAKVARVLGEAADADHYAGLATSLAAEYNARYLHTGGAGRAWYANDTEAANAVALDAGLVPARYRAAVVDSLVAAVSAFGNRIGTGSVAIGPLFRTLHAAGRDDVIYSMVTNPASPGYAFLVNSGHTTLTESLAGSGSQDHHFLGQVAWWLVHGLAGIAQAPDSVGYRRLLIRPAPVGDLDHVAATYTTPQGTASSSWTGSDGRLGSLHVRVPPNTPARVHVPASSPAETFATTGDAAVRYLGYQDGAQAYEVAPGQVTFTLGRAT